MDYEKKYKEALGWMQSVYPTMTGADKEDAEHFFPELAESEDERIRKELLDFCKNKAEYYPNDPKYKNISAWIAWLEKQSKDSPVLSNSSNTGKSSWGEEDEKISNVIIKKLTGSSDALCVDLQSAIGWIENIKDRVQPKQEWNEDDALKIDFVSKLLTGLDQEKYDSQCMKELSSWLQSLKGRVQPQPRQEWSEEDEKIQNDLMWIIEAYRKNGFNKGHFETANRAENWLKSLKEKYTWKPSDEQMSALSKAIAFVFDSNSDVKHSLESLYNELKKL